MRGLLPHPGIGGAQNSRKSNRNSWVSIPRHYTVIQDIYLLSYHPTRLLLLYLEGNFKQPGGDEFTRKNEITRIQSVETKTDDMSKEQLAVDKSVVAGVAFSNDQLIKMQVVGNSTQTIRAHSRVLNYCKKVKMCVKTRT